MQTIPERSLLIAGSRDIDEATAYRAIEQAYWMLSGTAPTTLITGDARGVDTWGVKWWKVGLGGDDTIAHYPARWDEYGKRAGYVRNGEMAMVADQAIIVWDGESRGTQHMLGLVERKGIEFVLVLVTDGELRFLHGGTDG